MSDKIKILYHINLSTFIYPVELMDKLWKANLRELHDEMFNKFFCKGGDPYSPLDGNKFNCEILMRLYQDKR